MLYYDDMPAMEEYVGPRHMTPCFLDEEQVAYYGTDNIKREIVSAIRRIDESEKSKAFKG